VLPYLQSNQEGVCLSVKVQPRASRNEIGEALGNELKIKIAAPPVDSAANDALVRFLAEVLDCARGDVQLMRGQTSRHKQILIRDMTIAEVEGKFSRWRSG
jgi:uncharacterized protein (TIGR00251 family)